MKVTYILFIILLANTFLYVRCGGDYTSIENKLMTGCWQVATPDDWKFVFKFYPGRWGSIDGKAHSFHLGQKAMENEIRDISVKNNEITMITNPAAHIIYNGKIVPDSLIITGKLHYRDGTSRQFNLTQVDEKSIPGLYPRRKTHGAFYHYQYQSPARRNDDWEISTLQREGLDSSRVIAAVREVIDATYGQIHSLLVVKNGKLVCEEYFFGHTWKTAHFLHSTTKSITSLLIGIAKDRNFIQDVEQPLFTFFPELDSLKTTEKSKILLRHLLTMTAGFRGTNPSDLDDDQPIIYELSRPLVTEPGEKFDYDGSSTNLLGGILKATTGQFADEFAKQTLFKSLNITRADWNYGKENGYPDCSGSLRLTPRDLAKIGQLVLNRGQWQGQPVVSAEWIKQSTRKHVDVEDPDDLGYGFQWWQAVKKIKGKKVEVIFANGWGSQFMFIFPEQQMVVVTTGGNQHNGKHFEIINLLEDYLLPAAL